MSPDSFAMYMLGLAALALSGGLLLLLGSANVRFRTKRIRVLLKSGDILIEKNGKLTEEGLEVDGKVYPISKDAIFFIKRGPRLYAYVIADSNTNAVYVVRNNNLEANAPPELLHKLALKRIMRHLTRREINVLPFFAGIMIGLILLGVGMVAFYNYKIIPAEQKAARAEAILGEYQQLKSQYSSLKTQYDQLQYQYNQLLKEYQNITELYDNCLNQTNSTMVENTTIARGGK